MYAELQISRQELSSRFRWFLTLPPSPKLISLIAPPQCLKQSDVWVYGYDAKWLGRFPVLIIHRDVTHKETLWWSVAKHENKSAVSEDLITLANSLPIHSPVGAVSDGKPGVTAIIKSIFHLENCQRCLVHVVRDLKRYLPLHSPIEATQHLRAVALTLVTIRSKQEQDAYLITLNQWYREYGSLLTTKSYPIPGSGVKRKWWYTHGNLRRAWRLMTKDPGSLFLFLENNRIPSTNNSLEGINRHLKRRAGMSKGKQLALMMWKLAFSRMKTISQQRRLWDIWKQQLKP